jgi:ribosomal protein S18 acetylase RimI-like enzyme
MASISVLPARRGDAAHLSRLARRLVEAGLTPVWTEARIDQRRSADDGQVLIARRGQGVVGGAIVRYEDRAARLELLVVEADCQRLGIGQQLLSACEGAAREAGLTHMRLEVRGSNRIGQSFYRARGYHEQHRVTGYYDGREDALRYERDLSAPIKPGV